MEELTSRENLEQNQQVEKFFKENFWDASSGYQDNIVFIKTLYTNTQELKVFSQQHGQNMYAIQALCHDVILAYTTRLIHADKMLKTLYGGTCSVSEVDGKSIVECKPCIDRIRELEDTLKLQDVAKIIGMEQEVSIVKQALSNILSQQ